MMSSEMKCGLGYVGAGLLGGAVGVLIGLLVAPASGRETRRRIARRAQDEKEHLVRKGERVVEAAEAKIEGALDAGKRAIESAFHS
jgi:gas vesicle protein